LAEGGQSLGPNNKHATPQDRWIRAAARAGALWVKIGILRRGASSAHTVRFQDENSKDVEMASPGSGDTAVGSSALPSGKHKTVELKMQELRRIGKDVIAECAIMGGTLATIGEVLAACLHIELWGAK
jgi:hypothetical protein